LETRDVVISGGEPLLNPEWREIATLYRSHGLGLWLLTSGLALAKYSRDVASLFHSVTVSMDGSGPETYSKIRGIDAFRKVCEGVRSVAASGVPTSLRVTLQRDNFRELLRFVSLARELGASQVSFLAVDVQNRHAFSRLDDSIPDLALRDDELEVFDTLLSELEATHAADFADGFIAETPQKLRRILAYFSALRGLRNFPDVRCNAPVFSAVVGADGSVSPCFFIAGPAEPGAHQDLAGALNSEAMRRIRSAIARGERPECQRCVCTSWRDPAALAARRFGLRRLGNE